MKYAVLLSASLLAGCMSPEQLVENAKEECTVIGYDIARERVPTLQRVERGYRIGKANQRVPVGLLVNAASFGVIAAR